MTFNLFSSVGDTIKEGLQAGFEKINPTINDIYNTLYGVNTNPFDIPNSITAVLTGLSILIIVVFGVGFLLQNASKFNQKQMTKKGRLVIIFVLITIWIGTLFYDDNKEITFNLHLIYKKTDKETNSLDDMGYKDIASKNEFSENPLSPNDNNDPNRRTKISLDVENQLNIKGNVKYENGLKLAVGVNPLIVSFSDIVDNKTYISQHDIYNSTNPKAIDSGADICLQTQEGNNSSNNIATFAEMINDNDDQQRTNNFKNMFKENSGYKFIGCVNFGYRKDLIFLNERASETGKGNFTSKNAYTIIPFYYPLDIINDYTIHNGGKDFLGDDFILKPTIQVGSQSKNNSEEEKNRNYKYKDFVKRFENLGIKESDFSEGDKTVINGFDIEKFSIIHSFNQSIKNNAKIYDENKYIDNIISITDDLYKQTQNIINIEEKIKLKNARLKNITDTGSLEEATKSLEADKALLEKLESELEQGYSKLVSSDSNLLKFFSNISLPPTLTEFSGLDNKTKLAKIDYIKGAVVDVKNNNTFYTDKEKLLRNLLYDLQKFENEDKTNTVAFFKGNTDLFQILTIFFNSKEIFGKNLETSDEFILKNICSDKKIDKINNKLTLMGIEPITKEVIDCEAGNKGTIVNKNTLIGIFNKIVAYQYKKDKLKDVNLMVYYGKIVSKNEQEAFGSLYATSYNSDVQPVNIGKYTLISPLYYYKKLLDGDFNGLPVFLNLKNIGGKVYLQDRVYDMKIGSPNSWYADLDGVHGEEYSNHLSIGIPVLHNILVILLLLINIILFGLAYLYVITLYIILLKSE